MIRQLNWNGILFGAGAGLILGLGLFAIVGGVTDNTLGQVLVQFVSFFVAGAVAGRMSIVGTVAAGGFAGLFLYFGLAVVSVAAGADVHPVALLFFGIVALILGSAGAVLVEAIRRR